MTAAIRGSMPEPARLDRLAWYYRRFRAMDGKEVAHRLGEAVKRRVSRFNRSGWDAFDVGDGAARHGDRYAVHRHEVAVALGHVASFDGEFTHGRISVSRTRP